MMHILQIHVLTYRGAAPSSRNAGCSRLPPKKDFSTSNLPVYGHITLKSHSCLYHILMHHQMCNDKENLSAYIYCSIESQCPARSELRFLMLFCCFVVANEEMGTQNASTESLRKEVELELHPTHLCSGVRGGVLKSSLEVD